MKKIFRLYAIPHIYLINWLQYFSYGKAAAIASFALFIFPFVLAVSLGRKDDWRTWLKGSVLQFASNMAFTLITNLFEIQGGSSGTWRGSTGIFYAEHLVLVLTFISLFLQLFFIGPLCAAKNNK